VEVQLFTPNEPVLAQPADVLDPAKSLFDPLPDHLAGPVSSVAAGAPIDGL